MLIVWFKFFICAAVIYLAGSRLAKYGDAIAEKTGLSRAWLGLVVLAAVTSLPELATGVSAALFAQAPDLAAGDLLGACMMNMFTLAMLDLIWAWRGKGSIFVKPMESNKVSILYGIIILIVISIALSLSRFSLDLTLWGISIYSVVILAIYLLSVKALQRFRVCNETLTEVNHAGISLSVTIFFFVLSAIAVIVAGSWLPFVGNEIVSAMGWGTTFVGVLFLALATTLPEMTVSFSAFRLGHFGMGIGNLIGSNVFDVSLIFIVDIFYRPASLYAAVSPTMILAALFGALLMAMGYYILYKRKTNHYASVAIVLSYLVMLFLLFKSGSLS